MSRAEATAVILNYNGRAYIDDCLAALHRQTVPVEIVVADNASGDGSAAYLREHFPGVRLLQFDRNWGYAEGYNRALAEVDAGWVVLLNNDAALEPDWVERLLAAAERYPRAAVLGGKLLFSRQDVPGRVVQSAGARFTDSGSAFEIGWGEPDRGQYDQPAETGSIPGAAMLIRLGVFRALGGFDGAYFAYLEDVDLCWRAWLAGHEVRVEPAAVGYHRFGASGGGRSSAFRIRWMQRNRLANMLKHLEPGSLPRAWAVSAAYDLYRLAEYSARGLWPGVRALALGTRDFWRERGALRAQRARIQRSRQLSDRDLRDRGLLVSAWTAFREYRRLNRLALSWGGGATAAPAPGADPEASGAG